MNVTVTLHTLGKQTSLHEDSQLIAWECDELGRNHPVAKLPPMGDLYKPHYEASVQEALAIWRECHWEEIPVYDQNVYRDRGGSLQTEAIQTGTTWVLREGSPLPWMSPFNSEETIRGEAIHRAAVADGSFQAALVALQEAWLEKALAEGGQCPPPAAKPVAVRPRPVATAPVPAKPKSPAKVAPKKVLPQLDDSRYVAPARAAGYTVIQKGEWQTWHVQGSFKVKGFGRKGRPVTDPPLKDFCLDRGICP